MLRLSWPKISFNNIFTFDNLNYLIDQTKKYRYITIPSITFTVSKFLLNKSLQTSSILAATTFVVSIIDQRKPELKNKTFEKIKNVLGALYDQYKKVQLEKKEKILTKEKKALIEKAGLMLSFLNLSHSQILKHFNDETSLFKPLCKIFGLSDIQILTLINYFESTPGPKKEDFDKRVENFMNLLNDDKKMIFNELIEKES